MPTDSTYPNFDVPNVDLWAFLFERNGRPFPDDKGSANIHYYHAKC